MKRIIYGYFGSLIIMMLFFYVVYNSIFESYGNGVFSQLAWTSKVMGLVFYPILSKLVIFNLLFFSLILLPLIWCANKFFKNKLIWSLLTFLLAGIGVSGLVLFAVEPIIATDYFEYGERQEFNKVLESIGYSFVNVMTYCCILLMSLFSWGITQLYVKDAQS